jgi:hypothetical protein
MKTIKTVEMTRSIRDTMHEKTKHMTPKEWRTFIRAQAHKMDTQFQRKKQFSMH